MKAIKIYLDDEHYELLKGLAEQKGLSLSALARELILKELGVKKESENKPIEGLNERLNELEKEVKEIKKELKRCCSKDLGSQLNAISNTFWIKMITDELLKTKS